MLCNAMFSCFVLFYPVNEGFFRSFCSNSDRKSYSAVEARAFCWKLFLRTCDLLSVPESHDIKPWVELMENDVIPDPGTTAVLEAELECYRGWFASSAEFDACARKCLYFLWIIGVELFAVKGMSDYINRSLALLVPRMFLCGSPWLLFASLVCLCSRLSANGWISAELEERVPLQFLTSILTLRANDVDNDLLEMKGVVWLWLTREGLSAELTVFLKLPVTTEDSFTPFQNVSQLALVTLGSSVAQLLVCRSELYPAASVFLL